MILLTETTMSLQVLLAGSPAANQAVLYAAYADHTSTTFVPGEQDALSNGTTAVDIVQAPAASTQRQVKYLSIYNADTATIQVTVRVNNNSTIRTLITVSLLPSERIEFVDSDGFRVLDAGGAIKASVSQFVAGTYIQANRNGTAQNITAATFTKVVFNTENDDALGEYNPATGDVTIKNSGRYLINGYVHVTDFANNTNFAVSVFRNSLEAIRVGEQITVNPTAALNVGSLVGGSAIMTMAQGDVINIQVFVGAQVAGGTLRVSANTLSLLSMMRAG